MCLLFCLLFPLSCLIAHIPVANVLEDLKHDLEEEEYLHQQNHRLEQQHHRRHRHRRPEVDCEDSRSSSDEVSLATSVTGTEGTLSLEDRGESGSSLNFDPGHLDGLTEEDIEELKTALTEYQEDG